MNSRAKLPVTRLRTVVFTALLAVLTSIFLHTTPAGAAFPGSNGKIAFETDSLEVWTMNPDGTGLTNVTNHPAFDGTPSWSADGTKIAFYSTRTGGSDIYTMNADGTSQVRVSSSAEGDFFPAWSPDGTRIAFHSFRNGNGNIFVINVDGTGEAGVTTAAEVDEVPSWSPDGTRIAFHSSRLDPGASSSDYDIFTIAPDGSSESNLTNNTGIDDSMPNWSPDGTQIVFIRNGEVWKINANGTGGTVLTTSGGTALEPVWSPDGTKIAYSGGPNSDIFTINANGTGQTNLTNSAAIDGSPDWQPTASPPPPPALVFHTVEPCRVVDTRTAGGPVVAGIDRTFTIVGPTCGIPATARAVSLNLAVTQPTASGNVRLYPADAAVPTVSAINYSSGQTRSNNAVVGLSAAGELKARCQPAGTVHLILDVNGYFQ